MNCDTKIRLYWYYLLYVKQVVAFSWKVSARLTKASVENPLFCVSPELPLTLFYIKKKKMYFIPSSVYACCILSIEIKFLNLNKCDFFTEIYENNSTWNFLLVNFLIVASLNPNPDNMNVCNGFESTLNDDPEIYGIALIMNFLTSWKMQTFIASFSF